MIYLMSDIHGHKEKFIKMLKTINFQHNDRLYILGDVIDRGPDPLAVLQIVADMRNAVFLIGNHEYMMYKSITEKTDFYAWFQNGGEQTYYEYKKLGYIEQLYLLNYIKKSYAVIPNLYCKKRLYYLVHAAPLEEYIDNPVKFNKLKNGEIYNILWDRKYTGKSKHKNNAKEHELFRAYKDTTLICGHSRTEKCYFGEKKQDGYYHIAKANKGKLIDIDCGCANNKLLGCLRLEDMKEFYV